METSQQREGLPYRTKAVAKGALLDVKRSLETTSKSAVDAPAAARLQKQSANPASMSKVVYQNYRDLVDRTVEVFGDELRASRWLSLPSPDFEGRTPLEAAQAVLFRSPDLDSLFSPVLLRIEHGIDS